MPSYYDEDQFDHQVLDFRDLFAPLLNSLGLGFRRCDRVTTDLAVDQKEVWAEDCSLEPQDEAG